MAPSKIPPHFAPPRWEKWLTEKFSDADNPAYVQIATVDRGKAGALPKVRTVHVKYVSENYHTLYFTTAVSSPKWLQLDHNSSLAGCYYAAPENIQFRWEGDARLLRADAFDPQFVARAWRQTRGDLREMYWEKYSRDAGLDSQSAADDINVVCPNFGIVLVTALVWDVYELNDADYHRSARTLFTWTPQGWLDQPLSLVDSASID